MSRLVVSAVLAELCLLATPVGASIRHYDLVMNKGTLYGNLTEGPMYMAADAPHWFGQSRQEAYVTVDGRISLSQSQVGLVDPWVLVTTLPGPPPSAAETGPFMGCEASMSESSGFVEKFRAQAESTDDWGRPITYIAQRRVMLRKTGYTLVTFFACSMNGTRATDVDLSFSGQVTFRNPYGYLPASLFSFLAFNGAMFLLYVALALVFGMCCVYNRRHLIRLQLFILGVIIMGALETAAWTFSYHEMNTRGEPACCPVRGDITFSFVLRDLKQTVSQLLLLAVCLGYGVVKPQLPRKTTILVLTLGCVYLAAALNYDIRLIIAISDGQSESDVGWHLPVDACAAAFIFWIYLSLNQVQRLLQGTGQYVKLGMYQRLARTLAFFVLVWIIFSIFLVMIQYKVIELPWKVYYALASFYDLLYYLILIAIAIIWAPSKRTESYAYSSQIPTDDYDDDDDESGMEMARVATSEAFAIGGDSDEEIEVDLGVEGERQRDAVVANV